MSLKKRLRQRQRLRLLHQKKKTTYDLDSLPSRTIANSKLISNSEWRFFVFSAEMNSSLITKVNKIGESTAPKCDRHKILQLEDSTLDSLPEYVTKILEVLQAMEGIQSQSDVLAILIYCIALESGFICTSLFDRHELEKHKFFWGYSFNLRNVTKFCKLPSDFNREDVNLYRFNLNLLDHYQRDCLLICLQTGDTFCVTFTPHNCPGKSILLSIPRYVLSIKVSNIAQRFRKLSELSYLLKDKLFTPIRNFLMQEQGESYPSLQGLPEELLLCIIRKLRPKDVISLGCTCSALHNICMNRYFQDARRTKRQCEEFLVIC